MCGGGGGGGEDGTCAAVRLIEGVRLIWGPLNTGLTVVQFLDRHATSVFVHLVSTLQLLDVHAATLFFCLFSS